MNLLSRLPLTIFGQHNARGHQRLARDQPECFHLATDHQQRTYPLEREQHAITVFRWECRNSVLSDIFKQRPLCTIGD